MKVVDGVESIIDPQQRPTCSSPTDVVIIRRFPMKMKVIRLFAASAVIKIVSSSTFENVYSLMANLRVFRTRFLIKKKSYFYFIARLDFLCSRPINEMLRIFF